MSWRLRKCFSKSNRLLVGPVEAAVYDTNKTRESELVTGDVFSDKTGIYVTFACAVGVL